MVHLVCRAVALNRSANHSIHTPSPCSICAESRNVHEASDSWVPANTLTRAGRYGNEYILGRLLNSRDPCLVVKTHDRWIRNEK